MKRLGGVYPQIIDFTNLVIAARRAARGKKNRAMVARFLFFLEYELVQLQRELHNGSYRPRPYNTFQIYDPKQRTISAAHFRDRVVHHAVCHVLDPWLERLFIADSYACRTGKGTHRALAKAQTLCRRFGYGLKCDIHKFFDSVDHRTLKELLVAKIKDRRLLELLEVIIDHDRTTGRGLPIGNLTSQYFANYYLTPLDRLIKQELQCKGYLRYMDDFLLFAADKPTLKTALSRIGEFLGQRLQLQLNPRATMLRPTWEGLPFLGMRVFPGMIKVKRENWRRFRRKFVRRQQELEAGIIDPDRAMRSIASLVGYLRHADSWNLRRQFFARYEMDF